MEEYNKLIYIKMQFNTIVRNKIRIENILKQRNR